MSCDGYGSAAKRLWNQSWTQRDLSPAGTVATALGFALENEATSFETLAHAATLLPFPLAGDVPEGATLVVEAALVAVGDEYELETGAECVQPYG